MNAHNGLRAILEAAQADAGCSAADLTVLSNQVDPYRLDTPTGHAEGAWLGAQMDELLDPWREIHLRGLHYALVASGSVAKPNGEPYRNTEKDWLWLQSSAAKAARWLGYVDWDRIVDARNEQPVIRIAAPSKPETFVSVASQIQIPAVGNLKPRVWLDGFEGRQAFNLVIYGEKTSLDDVLDPIARHYNASVYLPAGEISDTLLHTMARSGAEDGRPMVVFVLADFDPAGHQMAVSIGRKLQAFRDLRFPDLEFELHPVALTEDQVRELELPSTPLKETEKRADRWRLAHDGLEQTEIDALATLRPDVLRRIVRDALDPFFDHGLDDRVDEARAEWQDQAQTALNEKLDADLLAKIKAEAEAKLSAVRKEIEQLNEALRTATEDLDLDIPPPEPLEADPPGSEGLPLLSTAWSWTEQTRALKRRKAYGNGEAAP
jgi:hypothetical protein